MLVPQLFPSTSHAQQEDNLASIPVSLDYLLKKNSGLIDRLMLNSRRNYGFVPSLAELVPRHQNGLIS